MYIIVSIFVLLCPYVGLILVGLFPDEFEWLTRNSTASPSLAYYSLFLVGVLVALIQMQLNKNRLKIAVQESRQIYSQYPLLAVLFVITIIVIVGFSGLDVLLGSMTKEDVRQSGFVHAILTRYLAPSIFAYFSVLRRLNQLSRLSWWLAFLMTFLVGLSNGGKAGALIGVLPGLAVLFAGKLTLSRFLLIGVATYGSLILTAWTFDSFLDGDIKAIASYLVRRTFALTAEAPLHVGFAYSNNHPLFDYHFTLFEVFGKSVLLTYDSSIEIHKYLFSYAVTAWLYPEKIDAITSGIWNITPNVFVEALIVGGVYLLPVLGWAVMYGAYSLWNRVVRQINQGKHARAAITCVYAVMVYLSWINSAGVMQLVHPLAIGSLILSWLCLRTLSASSSWSRQVQN